MAALKRSHVLCGTAGVLILAGATVFRPQASADVPRVPSAETEVLEHVPSGSTDPRERQRAQYQRGLAARPDDRRTALALARLDIELSRARSDPRYLGYAQAALAAWWELPEPPPDVLVLRATIRQSSHDFAGALADLERVVAADPGDPQAWITRSVVLAVVGRYADARASCEPLARLAPPLVYAVCTTSIDAVTGHAAAAYAELDAAIAGSRRLSPEEEEWARSSLGEIALRLGRNDAAETAFRRALSVDPDDPYVLAACADLFLDTGRAAEARDLVGGRLDNDGLLLRLVLAEAALHASGAESHAALLGSRFDASHLRGDVVHRREEARFVLGIRHDPTGAARLARANWDVQREPWDVRILLDAAVAARDADAAAPALAFIAEHHLEDPRIAALAARAKVIVR